MSEDALVANDSQLDGADALDASLLELDLAQPRQRRRWRRAKPAVEPPTESAAPIVPPEETIVTAALEPAESTEPEHSALPEKPQPDLGATLDELDELAFPKGKLPLSTRSLGLAVVVALAFGGGILVQKSHDSGMIRPAAGQAAAAGGAGGGDMSAGAAVVGTITAVGTGTLTVRDQQGADHKVVVPTSAPVVKKVPVDALTTGAQVAVQGSTDSDGTVQATAVVAP